MCTITSSLGWRNRKKRGVGWGCRQILVLLITWKFCSWRRWYIVTMLTFVYRNDRRRGGANKFRDHDKTITGSRMYDNATEIIEGQIVDRLSFLMNRRLSLSLCLYHCVLAILRYFIALAWLRTLPILSIYTGRSIVITRIICKTQFSQCITVIKYFIVRETAHRSLCIRTRFDSAR